MKHLPKFLPWFARKSGISDELAAKLWRRASREIEGLLGSAKTPELHKRTVERFLGLVQQEAAVDHSANFSWVLRHQNHVAFMSLLAAETVSKAFRVNWSKMVSSCTAPYLVWSAR